MNWSIRRRSQEPLHLIGHLSEALLGQLVAGVNDGRWEPGDVEVVMTDLGRKVISGLIWSNL